MKKTLGLRTVFCGRHSSLPSQPSSPSFTCSRTSQTAQAVSFTTHSISLPPQLLLTPSTFHHRHVVIMAERYIPEHRRTNFKAKSTFKPDELRRRREEQQVEIRKQKREENLAKRRGIGNRGDGAPGASLGAAPDSDDEGANTESQVCVPILLHHTCCECVLTCY